MIQQDVEVLTNAPLAPGYFTMTLQCGAAFAASVPGQFVMLSLGTNRAPLLRRPFSIHRLTTDASGGVTLHILYKVIGEGTALMARMPAGTRLNLLGPLGQGFTIREDHQRVFLAAGGIGAAPMVFLLETLQRAGRTCRVFLGGRSRIDLLCRETFARWAEEVVTTTDDGSEGARCFLTNPLEEAARRHPPDVIMACGPRDMLVCVAGIAERLNVACQLSVESAMACGMGACLGCAVPGAEGGAYLHVCKDGPVFDARLLRL